MYIFDTMSKSDPELLNACISFSAKPTLKSCITNAHLLTNPR